MTWLLLAPGVLGVLKVSGSWNHYVLLLEQHRKTGSEKQERSPFSLPLFFLLLMQNLTRTQIAGRKGDSVCITLITHCGEGYLRDHR